MKIISSSNFYVYEYVRLDTNEPFYIGKGKDDRWRVLAGRNRYFTNVCKHTEVACIILHNKLDEQTAFEYECWYIWYLRDVLGYYLTNLTDGGEGVVGYKPSEEKNKKHSIFMTGENNPMFGKKRPKHSKLISGKNHPMARRIKVFNNDSHKEFDTFNDLISWFINDYGVEYTLGSLHKKIRITIKNGEQFKNFYIKYI
jgi:hypothetical protein